jgi:hypothetical protein
MWGTLSDKRTGLSFTTAPGPRKGSHFRVRVPWDLRPYFTVSDSRIPVSSPSMTRRVRVEVFDPTSTWVFNPITTSESESYITTDGQSASLSWNKAPIWGLRPDFYYCQTVTCLLMLGALSDERMGRLFTIAAGPRHSSHFRVMVSWDL